MGSSCFDEVLSAGHFPVASFFPSSQACSEGFIANSQLQRALLSPQCGHGYPRASPTSGFTSHQETQAGHFTSTFLSSFSTFTFFLILLHFLLSFPLFFSSLCNFFSLFPSSCLPCSSSLLPLLLTPLSPYPSSSLPLFLPTSPLPYPSFSLPLLLPSSPPPPLLHSPPLCWASASLMAFLCILAAPTWHRTDVP